MNKLFLAILLLSTVSLAWSGTLKLDPFDQAKLAELLEKMPSEVRARTLLPSSWYVPEDASAELRLHGHDRPDPGLLAQGDPVDVF